MYNPLFARKNDLMPDQQQMAEQFTLVSQPSEWSAPIVAQPPLRLFMVQARASNQAGAVRMSSFGNAIAEVFRFRDGRWWRERFTVEPGERIGSLKTQGKTADGKAAVAIDYATDWFLLDVVEDLSAADGDATRNWAAAVLLQSLSEQGQTQMRYPRDDSLNHERDYLLQEVRAAEITDVAAAGN